jgi:hypothetical protein
MGGNSTLCFWGNINGEKIHTLNETTPSQGIPINKLYG